MGRLGCRGVDLVTGAEKSRQVDLDAGADKSRRIDLPTGANKSRQFDWPPKPIRLDGLTWLLELIIWTGRGESTLPPEPTCLDGTWLPEPTCLDRSTWPPEPTHLDVSRWVNLASGA